MNTAAATLKKYFIPDEGNDHRPHALRPRAVAFVAVVLVAVQIAFIFGVSYVAPRSRLFGLILANALIVGTNENRTANGLSALRESPLLDAAAQEKANDMVANDYFAHTSPSGLTPWYWFLNVGYDFSSAGENLAVNFSDSQDVTDAWMNSPEHRANIMDINFTQIGMATAQGEYDGAPATYVVELFGTPAASAASFIAASADAAGGPPAKSAPAVAPSAPATVPVTAPSAAPASPAQKPATVVSPAANPGSAAVSNSPQSSVAATSATTPVSVSSGAPAPAANPIQFAAADPRQVTDAIYLIIAGIFIAALAFNTFIKVRIQHAQVIFGGLFVLIVAGSFILLNAHFSLAGAAIF